MDDDGQAERELLRLIGRGVSDSADRLAKISRTEWVTQTVSISMAPLAKFQGVLAGDAEEHFGAHFTLPGGVFLVMIPSRSGPAFADAFLPASKKHPEGVKDRERSSLAEISNIVVNAVAAVVADACGMALMLSAPEVSHGRKADLLREAREMVSSSGEKSVVMAYVHMSSEALSSDCSVVVLMSEAWQARLFAALE
ncbi:MAG: hypothetical protein A2V88_11080 [Elusimicrobia bacterium RBG_16_66_12]|nr:MAG: hypothetical protein A2V88_11080 [Elusimicrobia bacterium RBG_16_66_12]